MKKISLRSKGDDYHYDLAVSIARAVGMTPKMVLKAGVELLYQQIQAKSTEQKGGTTDDN